MIPSRQRTLTQLLGGLAATTLVLAACGGDGQDAQSADGDGAAADGEPILIGNIADLS
jgi:hypothetical protein